MHSELKKQTKIAGIQYQGINQFYRFDKKEGDGTISKEENDSDKTAAI